jgi:hypothetical protein
MLSHRHYSHALHSKERSGTRGAQCRKRIKLIKNLPVYLQYDQRLSHLNAVTLKIKKP